MGESTRKNPDKLIAQLKNKISFLRSTKYIMKDRHKRIEEAHAEEVVRLKGEHWLTLKEEAQYAGNLSDSDRPIPRLNQKVVIAGFFTKLERTDNEGYPNRFVISLTDVSLKED